MLLAPLTHAKAKEAKLELQSHHVVVAQPKQIEVQNVLVSIHYLRRPQIQVEGVILQGMAADLSEEATPPDWLTVDVEKWFETSTALSNALKNP